jgi:cytochrome b pre-mRNA-processing protein 3
MNERLTIRVSFYFLTDYRAGEPIGKLRSAQLSWLMDRLFPKKAAIEGAADRLYEGLVHAARSTWLFTEGGFEDSFSGRFNAIALHGGLLLPELERRGGRGPVLSRAVYTRIFDGLDAGLRETGVGDASIARKVRKFGESFFGLGNAIRDALAASDSRTGIAAVLERNEVAAADEADKLADYVIDFAQHLSSLSDETLFDGDAGLVFMGKRAD